MTGGLWVSFIIVIDNAQCARAMVPDGISGKLLYSMLPFFPEETII